VVNSTYSQGDTAKGVWIELSGRETIVQMGQHFCTVRIPDFLTMYAGDYAAIKILRNGFRHALFIPARDQIFSGVAVTLVPGVFPCTYEKIEQKHYFFAAFLPACTVPLEAKVRFCLKENCVKGAVQPDVLRVGFNRRNPYPERNTMRRY